MRSQFERTPVRTDLRPVPSTDDAALRADWERQRMNAEHGVELRARQARALEYLANAQIKKDASFLSRVKRFLRS